MGLLSGQDDVSPQRGMPVDDKGASSSIVSFTEPSAIQFFFYSGSTRTADAGQAAGVAVVAQLTYDNIKNVSGAYQASHNDTSLAFTSTAFTTQVEWKSEWSGLDRSTEKAKLEAITSGFTNGQYAVDYSTGAMYGKKASTQTTLTAVSYKIKQNQSGSGSGAGGISLIASTTGGASTLFDADGDNTAQACKTSAGSLYGLHIINSNVADAYLQLFDLAVASVTVGTTTPKQSYIVPAQGAVEMVFSVPLEFLTAITYSCTTTPTGNGDPTTGLTVNLAYK